MTKNPTEAYKEVRRVLERRFRHILQLYEAAESERISRFGRSQHATEAALLEIPAASSGNELTGLASESLPTSPTSIDHPDGPPPHP